MMICDSNCEETVRRWGDGEEVGPDSGKCQGGETVPRRGDIDEVGRQ